VEERIEAGAPIRGDGLMEIEVEVGRTAQCCDDCGDACSRIVVPRFALDAQCTELCRLADAVMEGDLSDTVRASRAKLLERSYWSQPTGANVLERTC
jgi:hypothetical protein